MLINFTDEKEMTIPCMNNGTGMMTAKVGDDLSDPSVWTKSNYP